MFDLIESQFRHNTEDLLLNSLVLRKKASSFEVCTIILQIMFRVCMAPKEKYPRFGHVFFSRKVSKTILLSQGDFPAPIIENDLRLRIGYLTKSFNW